MIHFNLGSHDGRTIEELTSLVEATESSAAHGEQRDSATSCQTANDLLETKPQIHPNDQEAREYRKKFPFGADLADNACRGIEE